MNIFWNTAYIMFFFTLNIQFKKVNSYVVAEVEGKYDCSTDCQETITYQLKVCKGDCNSNKKRVKKRIISKTSSGSYKLYISFSSSKRSTSTFQQNCIVPTEDCNANSGISRDALATRHYSTLNLNLLKCGN
uniref:Uncharacterized protein n=1 Tax=Strongyloides papillosus TaxID=174720 RepID=A0A0N5CIU5_STREA